MLGVARPYSDARVFGGLHASSSVSVRTWICACKMLRVHRDQTAGDSRSNQERNPNYRYGQDASDFV